MRGGRGLHGCSERRHQVLTIFTVTYITTTTKDNFDTFGVERTSYADYNTPERCDVPHAQTSLSSLEAYNIIVYLFELEDRGVDLHCPVALEDVTDGCERLLANAHLPCNATSNAHEGWTKRKAVGAKNPPGNHQL